MDPICFHIGSRPIHWYGVMMASAFLAGMAHWTRLGRKEGRDSGQAADLAFWMMVGGILGARVAYVLGDWETFRRDPSLIVRIDQGGLVFYGGFIGAVLALVLVARWRHERVLALGDFAITALPLGHAFGRVGCFLNGCCGGLPVAGAPWWAAGLAHYPVQLYEALANLVVYAVLTRFYLRQRGQTPGRVVALYLLIYPVARFFLEFLRGDIRLRWAGLTLAQVISLTLFLIGSLLWTVTRRHDHADHTA